MIPLNEIDGYDAYCMYLAIQTHFTTDKYDFFEADGKINASRESYEKRRDKIFFKQLRQKFPKRKDMVLYLVANFCDCKKHWIGDLIHDDESRNKYMKMKQRWESLEYSFKSDVIKILDIAEKKNIQFDGLFKVVDNHHPVIVQLATQNEISLETFILLDKILNHVERIDKNLNDPYSWGNLKRKCEKLEQFFCAGINMEKYKAILKNEVLSRTSG